MEAKNETFAPQHPDQYLPGKPPRNSQSVLTPWRKIHAGDPVGGVSLLARLQQAAWTAFAVTDVRETLRTGAPKNAEMVRYRWHAGVVKARMWRV